MQASLAGEVLGCTSPNLSGLDACVFVADGRFHPESVLIANPRVPLYRYDPYAKAITHERYEHAKMHALRQNAIDAAKGATRWGLVLGTLGRQGNPDVLQHLQRLLDAKGCTHVTLLLSEVFPAKLAEFSDIEAWIQVCCPRLSIDWGHAFDKPFLAVRGGGRAWHARLRASLSWITTRKQVAATPTMQPRRRAPDRWRYAAPVMVPPPAAEMAVAMAVAAAAMTRMAVPAPAAADAAIWKPRRHLLRHRRRLQQRQKTRLRKTLHHGGRPAWPRLPPRSLTVAHAIATPSSR